MLALSILETYSILNSEYGKPRNTVHMNNVHCTGDESTILDCEYFLYDFEVGKDILYVVQVAGVNCLGKL